MAIEPATADDAGAIAQIHVDAWRAAYVGILPDDHLASLSVDEREAMWRDNARAMRFYERVGFAVEPASLQRFTLGGRAIEELRYATVI
jgi:hypothetical protein